MKEQLIAALQTQAVLSDGDVVREIVSGMGDSEAGRIRTIDEVRESLPKGKERA